MLHARPYIVSPGWNITHVPGWTVYSSYEAAATTVVKPIQGQSQDHTSGWSNPVFIVASLLLTKHEWVSVLQARYILCVLTCSTRSAGVCDIEDEAKEQL